jgi:hypothetical protein
MRTQLQLYGRRAVLPGRRKTCSVTARLYMSDPTSSSALTGQQVAQVQLNGTYTVTTGWP